MADPITKQELDDLLIKIQLGQLSAQDIDLLNDRIKLTIKSNPLAGRELGAYLAKVKQASKVDHSGINWVSISKGSLGIGHKPGGKVPFEGLASEGTSAVITLLHENEGAAAIGSKSNAAGIDWIWFPFSASNPHQGDDLKNVFELFEQVHIRLGKGEKIYIHCSAGIHRTGMITYGLLRYIGYQAAEAQKMLAELREVTAAQVGEERLVWGDQFFSDNSINSGAFKA